MNDNSIKENPFSVSTPETLSPEALVELFVPLISYGALQVSGHQFIHGHRGSGKSMMMRAMEPACQKLIKKVELENLQYYGVYVRLKTADLRLMELEKIKGELGYDLLSEHLLVGRIIWNVIYSIRENIQKSIFKLDDNSEEKKTWQQKSERFIEFVMEQLKVSGYEIVPPSDNRNLSDPLPRHDLSYLLMHIKNIQQDFPSYARERAFGKGYVPYQGTILTFSDVLNPMVEYIKREKIIPNGSLYLLLDDADNLSKQQTMILNTWISYRSTDYMSFKVSTQLNYKTSKTTLGTRIEAPHDYANLYHNTPMTGGKREYGALISKILERRLDLHGLGAVSLDSFFPVAEKQEKAIKEIEKEYKAKWEEKKQIQGKGGYTPEDDAGRNARPEYISRLASKSKQSRRYLYAGYSQLVHISSGIIRHFLDFAYEMYAEAAAKEDQDKVFFIAPVIQDKVIRKKTTDLLKKINPAFVGDIDADINDYDDNDMQSQLYNLIDGVGHIFKDKLMDGTASERRVYSFRISGSISDAIKTVLRHAMSEGYLYQYAYGSKIGGGRDPVYILTRQLAPAYHLDPTGFAGLISIKARTLEDFIRRGYRRSSHSRRVVLKHEKHEEPLFDFQKEKNDE